MAPWPSCWPTRRPMPMPRATWTGWSRGTPPWSGCTSTEPVLGGSAATPRPPAAMAMAIRRLAGNRGSNGVEATGSHCSGDPVVPEPVTVPSAAPAAGSPTAVGDPGRAADRRQGQRRHHVRPVPGRLRVARSRPSRPRTRRDGYGSRTNQALLHRRGIAHTIPEPRDQQANRRRKVRGRPPGRLRRGPLRPPQGRRTRLLSGRTVTWTGHSLRRAGPQVRRRARPRRATDLAPVIRRTLRAAPLDGLRGCPSSPRGSPEPRETLTPVPSAAG